MQGSNMIGAPPPEEPDQPASADLGLPDAAGGAFAPERTPSRGSSSGSDAERADDRWSSPPPPAPLEPPAAAPDGSPPEMLWWSKKLKRKIL